MTRGVEATEGLPAATRHGPATRTGLSAPEAIVALLLGLLVVHLGLSTMARMRTTEARLAARADGLVAMRVARHVLRRELDGSVPGRDWLVDDDSLSLRAFRGAALVCALDSATVEVTVSYSGVRRPDPSKDSVLLLDPSGSGETRALVGVGAATTGCGPVESDGLELWRLDAPVGPSAVVARLFERGSYHLSGAALRYRRGASGRQPLTPEVWADETAWTSSSGRLGIDVRHATPDAGRDWSGFLAWTDPP